MNTCVPSSPEPCIVEEDTLRVKCPRLTSRFVFSTLYNHQSRTHIKPVWCSGEVVVGVSRRFALRCTMLGAAMLVFRGVTAGSKAENRVSFRWMVPEAHRKTVENGLTYDGAVERAAVKGVVVWVFVGLVLLPYLVQAVIKLQRQLQFGGVVIDTRKDPLAIRVDKRLPRGLIVVIQPDGKVLFERDEVEDPEKLVRAVVKGLGGT